VIEYRGKEYYNTMKMSSSTLTLFLEKSPRKVAADLTHKKNTLNVPCRKYVETI